VGAVAVGQWGDGRWRSGGIAQERFHFIDPCRSAAAVAAPSEAFSISAVCCGRRFLATLN